MGEIPAFFPEKKTEEQRKFEIWVKSGGTPGGKDNLGTKRQTTNTSNQPSTHVVRFTERDVGKRKIKKKRLLGVFRSSQSSARKLWSRKPSGVTKEQKRSPSLNGGNISER